MKAPLPWYPTQPGARVNRRRTVDRVDVPAVVTGCRLPTVTAVLIRRAGFDALSHHDLLVLGGHRSFGSVGLAAVGIPVGPGDAQATAEASTVGGPVTALLAHGHPFPLLPLDRRHGVDGRRRGRGWCGGHRCWCGHRGWCRRRCRHDRGCHGGGGGAGERQRRQRGWETEE